MAVVWSMDDSLLVRLKSERENSMKEKEKIIAYIDKLLEKYPKNYYLLTVAEFIDHLQEEPVSEDLDEAAKKYSTKKHPMTTTGADESACDFKAGAKWQKEQLMTKAIDAHVNYAWSGLCFGGFDWSKTGLDMGDKCKLIIIKED